MGEAESTIRRFLGGDGEAFNELVRQWESKVFNLAWRFLGNREDAQDIAQETFLSVFRSLRDLRDPKSFPAWIYRITLNHCRAARRSRRPEVTWESVEGPHETLRNTAEPAATGGDPLEVRDLIRKALSGLSEEHRMAVILKEYVGLSLEEIAQVMDCPLSTAKSRLYHGLRGVQRKLRHLL